MRDYRVQMSHLLLYVAVSSFNNVVHTSLYWNAALHQRCFGKVCLPFVCSNAVCDKGSNGS